MSGFQKATTGGLLHPIFVVCILLELLCIAFLAFLLPAHVSASVGQDNVTVPTILSIGNSFPEFIQVTVNWDNAIDLSPNATVTVYFEALIRDFNGEDDINSVSLEFFDSVVSSYGAANDNNTHYANSTCSIDTTYGDGNEVNATCTIDLYYYANNATWNATFLVNDSQNSQVYGSGIATVNTLLALGLPDIIDYGTVNATEVSDEIQVNVTNFGNVAVNLSLSSYGATINDGWALNCTQGTIQNISVEHQKYNLTASNPGVLTFAEFDLNYTNSTSAVTINQFDLAYQQTEGVVDATNGTYWRVYVPTGVAGTCTGNVVFGAVESPAT